MNNPLLHGGMTSKVKSMLIPVAIGIIFAILMPDSYFDFFKDIEMPVYLKAILWFFSATFCAYVLSLLCMLCSKRGGSLLLRILVTAWLLYVILGGIIIFLVYILNSGATLVGILSLSLATLMMLSGIFYWRHV